MPQIDLDEEKLQALAEKTASRGLTVPGVQKKISLHLSQEGGARLTLVDYPAGFILKPQTELIRYMPEAEDMVMRMAAIAGIAIVPHGLICMEREKDSYAYITRRIDRRISKRKTE